MSTGGENTAGRIMITTSQDVYFNIWISLSLKSMLGGFRELNYKGGFVSGIPLKVNQITQGERAERTFSPAWGGGQTR